MLKKILVTSLLLTILNVSFAQEQDNAEELDLDKMPDSAFEEAGAYEQDVSFLDLTGRDSITKQRNKKIEIEKKAEPIVEKNEKKVVDIKKVVTQKDQPKAPSEDTKKIKPSKVSPNVTNTKLKPTPAVVTTKIEKQPAKKAQVSGVEKKNKAPEQTQTPILSAKPSFAINKLDSLSRLLYNSKELKDASVSIAIYDLQNNKALYTYNSNKKLIPASNVKILTTYAVLKYLPEKIETFSYVAKGNGDLLLFPAGDPTLMYNKFVSDSAIRFLSNNDDYKNIVVNTAAWQDDFLGYGWSWEDYGEYFMPQKSIMPLFGNVVNVQFDNKSEFVLYPKFFRNNLITLDFIKSLVDTTCKFQVKRDYLKNILRTIPSTEDFAQPDIPVIIEDDELIKQGLNFLTNKNIIVEKTKERCSDYSNCRQFYNYDKKEVLKFMMRESNNFVAEQLVLSISNKLFGIFNSDKALEYVYVNLAHQIPSILKMNDGSGLSRYNLLSTNEIIAVLKMLANENKWETLTYIFPTGGTEPFANFLTNYGNVLYAKTGTMKNIFNLSGYLMGHKGKNKYAFSILSNQFSDSTGSIKNIYQKYLDSVIPLLE